MTLWPAKAAKYTFGRCEYRGRRPIRGRHPPPPGIWPKSSVALPLRPHRELRQYFIRCEHRIAREADLHAHDVLAQREPRHHRPGIEALPRHRQLDAIVERDAGTPGAQREILRAKVGCERRSARLIVGTQSAGQRPRREAATRCAPRFGSRRRSIPAGRRRAREHPSRPPRASAERQCVSVRFTA